MEQSIGPQTGNYTVYVQPGKALYMWWAGRPYWETFLLINDGEEPKKQTMVKGFYYNIFDWNEGYKVHFITDKKRELQSIDVHKFDQPASVKINFAKQVVDFPNPNYQPYTNPSSMVSIETNRTINISTNQTQVIKPTNNYNAMSQITITTDVPTDTTVIDNADVDEDNIITENGDFMVPANKTGWNSFVVDVQPDLEQKSETITENGTITIVPSSGKDGLSQVLINTEVQIPELQELKTYQLESDQPVNIYPSSGYDGIEVVRVSPKNFQYESPVTTNGPLTIPNGFSGLANVIINVPTTSVNNYTYPPLTGNGEYRVPDNYTGLNSVTVAVPSDINNLSNQVFTENGYQTIPSGYSGFGNFRINVPEVINFDGINFNDELWEDYTFYFDSFQTNHSGTIQIEPGKTLIVLSNVNDTSIGTTLTIYTNSVEAGQIHPPTIQYAVTSSDYYLKVNIGLFEANPANLINNFYLVSGGKRALKQIEINGYILGETGSRFNSRNVWEYQYSFDYDFYRFNMEE